jgi:imidazolonepropionase-like amidohydrolase
MGPAAALRALTSDAARILAIDDKVGLLQPGMDADVLLLDGAPLEPATSVLRAFVAGKEIR